MSTERLFLTGYDLAAQFAIDHSEIRVDLSSAERAMISGGGIQAHCGNNEACYDTYNTTCVNTDGLCITDGVCFTNAVCNA